jgi:hypothetical protein
MVSEPPVSANATKNGDATRASYHSAGTSAAPARNRGAKADPAGVARTPVPGLTIIRMTAPSGIDYAISRPLVCLVLQGTKHVAFCNRALTFSAGDSMLITADVPTASHVRRGEHR